MSAPSGLHDARQSMLETIAQLSGYCTRTTWADGEVPDLVRIHHSVPSVFVGDAKATESPGCEATRRRLTRYFRTARRWNKAGFDVRVALCHPGRDDARWLELLLGAAR